MREDDNMTNDDSERIRKAEQTYRNHTGKEHKVMTSPYDPASLKDLTDLTFLGSYGASWSRPGLDLRTKSFISMTITASLGAEEQFKAHLRAAHHVGITKDEIVEMLIHFNGYLGTPKTNIAKKLSQAVWKELGEAGLNPI
jgi:alkylhydroperoxidase/carboxymuconolactone decarboxylase family protein YurZ